MPPRAHPLVRTRLVERANGWLERVWGAGLCSRPVLDPEALWRKACLGAPAAGEHGGRSAADVTDFRLRLEQLSASLEHDAALNPLGRTLAHGQLVRAIRHRLWLGALWQRRPGLPAQAIAPPIIVVGQMRSGTTRVHRLLASDPAHAGTRFCDSWHPAPPGRIGLDLRPLRSALLLLVARKLDPWLDSIHPFGVTRPDEELGWLATSLDHCAYEAQWRIPGFTAFSEARDPAPVYDEFARILRTDAAMRGNAGLRRVLKVPQFAEDLPALLARFPDAAIVRTRRDAAEVAASAVSLVGNQMAIQSDSADLAWIEGECRRKIALREGRLDRALDGWRGPLAEVSFCQLETGWEAQVDRLYAALALPFTDAARAAMCREQGRAARATHGQHARSYRAFARA